MTISSTKTTLGLSSRDNVFVTGFAGVGKTYFLGQFIKSLTVPEEKLFLTAPTWQTALVLEETLGAPFIVTSFHVFAGVRGPVFNERDPEKLVLFIKRHPPLLSRWLSCDTLALEEGSLAEGELFATLEKVARLVRGSNQFFGGIRLIVSADFLQLGSPKKGSDLICNTACWLEGKFRIHLLSDNRRFKSPVYAALVPRLAFGALAADDWEFLKTLEKKYVAPVLCPGAQETLELPTYLRARNAEVDRVNKDHFDLLDAETERCFATRDEFFPLQFARAGVTAHDVRKGLDDLAPSSLIRLRKGARVMFVGQQASKKQRSSGVRRGTIGVVTRFASAAAREEERGFPVVRFRITAGKDVEMIILPQTLLMKGLDAASDSVSTQEVTLGSRSRLPLQLAWAMTIHKAEGLTLPLVHIDLGTLFCAGQGYVGLTRSPDAGLGGLWTEGVEEARSKGLIFADRKAVDYYKTVT
jgi:hypothetical protein